MNILLDTNILTCLAQKAHVQHDVARQAVDHIRRQNHFACVMPQNLYEFWAVSTRPIGPQNGLGLTIEETKDELVRIRSLCLLLPETAALFNQWEDLVARYAVKGKNTHDARLVAAMLIHGLKNILTFNAKDFSRYTEINVVEPQNLAAQMP